MLFRSAETVTLDGPTAAQAILDYARMRNVNRILVGRRNRRGWRALWRPSTTVALVRGATGQDIHIVGGEEEGAGRNPLLARSSVYLGVAPRQNDKPRWLRLPARRSAGRSRRRWSWPTSS